MTNWDLYRTFLTFIATIVFTRLASGFMDLQGHSVTLHIGNFQVYHLYLGLVIFILAQLIVRKSHTIAALINGFSWGWVIDEITLPLYLLGFTQFTYWYFGSILAVLVGVVVVSWKTFFKAPQISS